MNRFFPLALIFSCGPVWAQHSLSVRVVDAAGAPIAGARVQARVWNEGMGPIVPKVTAANGTAVLSFPTSPSGKGKAPVGNVVAGAKGFAFGQALIVGKKVELRLERGVPWRGRVVDENGKPLAGATVALRGVRTNGDYRYIIFSSDQDDPIPILYSAKSDANGTFVINDVPAEKDLIYHALRPGYSLVQGGGGRAGTEEQIKLVPAGSVRGRVLDPAGKPIANIKIYAGSANGIGGNETTTDATGAFTIGHLVPGLYRITPNVPGNAPYILSRRSDVRVEAGKTAEVGPWRAQRGVVIRGIVRDATSKKPIAGASFAAANSKDAARYDDSAWASSDTTGHFALRVLPGKYQVRSSGAPLGFMRSNATQSVEVSAKGSSEIEFVLQPSPTIRGVTLNEQGKPMAARLTIGGMMGYEIPTDAQGKWRYTPQSSEDLTFGGGADESGYFEVVSPKKVDWPVAGPVYITMRRKPWGKLEGRVVTPEGTPVEGVRVEGEFVVMMGDSMGYGAKTDAVSGKDGRFVLERLRDAREVKVTGKRAGFEFQSGGAVSGKGSTLSVTDLVFAPLAGKVEGTTQPGAVVVVAGRETRADDKGHFAFAALPSGQNTVFAAKDGNFGSASATTPLTIQLKPLQPQVQDKALAERMWAEIVRENGDKEANSLEKWLTPLSFEEELKAAQATGDQNRIVERAARWKSGDSLEVLRAGLEAITEPDQRADSFLTAALATNDMALMKRALEVAETTFKGASKHILWREPQLYRAAVLRERLNGEEDGKLALQRALAFTLANHAEKSRTEGVMQTQVGRNEAICDAASIVAAGSPALLREVLDSIDDGSGFEVRALADAIPVVAKTHGLGAILPLLEELKTMPAPTLDMERRYMVFDVDWAYGQAVYAVMPFIGPRFPVKALELAKKVEGDEQRARALASAAKFQSPEVAAPLYREAVAKIGSEDAPRVAAVVWERDPKLGLELLSLARKKAEDEMKSEFHGRNSWVPFAFYFARANPAMSRLVLEREWSQSVKAKVDGDELAAIALAMAPVDAQRAMQLARLIPGDGYSWGMGARRKIARFVFADETTRRGFVLNRIGSREAWDAGTVQW